jgi:murein DD-endopeptidase MepM/ murein hydrolase activator NlpD
MQYRKGQSIARDEPAFAVADATVALVRDGRPDDTPAPVDVPSNAPQFYGNDRRQPHCARSRGGQYARYAHLQPGSILVRSGERARGGERLARIDVSGDSNVPHLHFKVTNSRTLLAGEGLPYVFDRHRASAGRQAFQSHTRELPLGGMVINMGEGRFLTRCHAYSVI